MPFVHVQNPYQSRLLLMHRCTFDKRDNTDMFMNSKKKIIHTVASTEILITPELNWYAIYLIWEESLDMPVYKATV